MEVCTSTNMSKKLSAGKSTPGVCWVICPGDTKVGDSRIVTGPSTPELPVRFMAIISVWMVVRPPGPQPTQGSCLCTVDGPDRFTVSVPTPVMLITTCAAVVSVSLPADGNTQRGVDVAVAVGEFVAVFEGMLVLVSLGVGE